MGRPALWTCRESVSYNGRAWGPLGDGTEEEESKYDTKTAQSQVTAPGSTATGDNTTQASTTGAQYTLAIRSGKGSEVGSETSA